MKKKVDLLSKKKRTKKLKICIFMQNEITI